MVKYHQLQPINNQFPISTINSTSLGVFNDKHHLSPHLPVD